MDIDTIIKILKIILMVLMPLMAFFLSFKYASSIEDKKNNVSAIYNWNNKWAEMFFESHKNYQGLILSLLHDCELLRDKVAKNEQNSDEGTKVQLRMNSTMQAIHKAGLELQFQISSVSNDSEAIKSSTDRIYEMVKQIFNTREYRHNDIVSELRTLRDLVKMAHKEALSKVA
ncbi:hypothetical protein [Vibrio caribbeanicus]|uniref:hypothetical protein n=1 Tax=Vibrio caribbeanicus TaxID=701175 RepID=UPI002283AD82|nr:hypothetical protein [Vibrio caribbeanicus]MCY9846414.1 hypothetical protein [Vibrio caribbeanicus]